MIGTQTHSETIKGNKMAITKEQAKKDLETVMKQFGTVGAGSEKDRAAQLVMQTLGVLERRLGNPKIIKMLYLDNLSASKLLPETVYEVAQQYVRGSIDRAEAAKRLQEASRQYEKAFKEMGIKPQGSSMLFGGC